MSLLATQSSVLDSVVAAAEADWLNQLRDLEVVDRTSLEDVHLLMQVARHLPRSELEVMHDCIEFVSVTDVISMLKRCNEPFAKDCELCRQKRLHDLDFRKVNKQIPSGVI